MDLEKSKIEDKLLDVELKGIGSSGSIAFGYINFIFDSKKIKRRKIKENKIDQEINLFLNVSKELEDDFQNISNNLNYEFDKIAEIYQLNILLLNDPIIKNDIIQKIKSLNTALYSGEFIFNKYIKQLKATDDLLLKERAGLIEEIIFLKKNTIK